MEKKLYRDEYNRKLGGVCAGLAEYFDMDVTVVRLLFAFSVIIMGVGFIPYIILWIVLPRKGYFPNGYKNQTVDYTVPPQPSANQGYTPPQYTNATSGNTFGGNPFSGNPVQNVAPKQKSHAGIIIGFVLIIIGAAILIDNYDLFPDFDLERLWPAVFVIVGGALIVSGQKRQPWEKQDLDNANTKDNSSNDNPSATDETSTVES